MDHEALMSADSQSLPASPIAAELLRNGAPSGPGQAAASAVLERITDAFFALDQEWRFTYLNDQAERLLSRTRADLLGRCIWAEFPQAVGSTFEREYRGAVESGASADFEEFYAPLDTWFEVRAYPSQDGLSVFFRDVTKQRATALALAESERRLRLAMSAARLGSFAWDMTTGRVDWSEDIERMHGIPVGSFEGTFDAYQRDMHAEDRDRVLAIVAASVERGESHHLEYRIVRPDGAIRWLRAHGQYERDPATGRPSRLVGVCQDVTEEREAEDASRFQRYILQLVADNATSALFMMDRDGHPTFMNPAAERMTGYTLAEIRDFPLHYAVHRLHPDGSRYPMAECPIDRALPENSDVRAHEDVFVRKDGSFFPVLCAASPIIEDGIPVGTVVEVRDVTEEKTSRERLRMLTEAIPVQVWTATPDGGLDYVSRRVVDYFGASETVLMGNGWTALVHPDDLPMAASRWTQALESGQPYEAEFRLRRADGQYRWHLARALPQRDVRGSLTRWFGSNTDIDDRRMAEQERDRVLAEAQAARFNLFRAFEQAPAAISVTEGPDHVATTQNAISRQLVAGRNLIGIPVREALPELEGQGFFEILDGVYASGEPFEGRELPVRWDPRGDGQLHDGLFDVVYQPLRDGTGQVYGILSHSLEVTEQVRARREVERKAAKLARLANALQQTNKELDQFAYVASHDLKAPLRGIANLAQWIEEDLGDRITGESLEHMRLLKGRVHRMEGLIDGILAYSRAGRASVSPEHIDVPLLLREVIDLLAVPSHVEFDIASDIPPLVAERTPLQQVFLNLIGNAVKYGALGRDAAHVRVHCEVEDDHVEFIVSDDGPGIAPEFHDRVWGIFQTLQPRDKVEGTGIGLSVVKKIIETRGGRVWLVSAPGEGASFHFTMPRVARREAVEPDDD